MDNWNFFRFVRKRCCLDSFKSLFVFKTRSISIYWWFSTGFFILNLSMSSVHGSKQPVHIFFNFLFSLQANHIMFASKRIIFKTCFITSHVPANVLCVTSTLLNRKCHIQFLSVMSLAIERLTKGTLTKVTFHMHYSPYVPLVCSLLLLILLKTWCGSPINHSIDLSFILIFHFITTWLCSQHSWSSFWNELAHSLFVGDNRKNSSTLSLFVRVVELCFFTTDGSTNSI